MNLGQFSVSTKVKSCQVLASVHKLLDKLRVKILLPDMELQRRVRLLCMSGCAKDDVHGTQRVAHR